MNKVYRVHSRPCTAPWHRWVVQNVCHSCDMLQPLNETNQHLSVLCELRNVRSCISERKVFLWTPNLELSVENVGVEKSFYFALWLKKDAASKPLVSQFWSLVGALGSVLRALLDPRWGFWRHLPSIFSDLRKALGVQGSFKRIFIKFWTYFGFQNGGERGSGEACKGQAVSDIDFNRIFADFETEIHAFKRSICVFLECDMKCMGALRCT